MTSAETTFRFLKPLATLKPPVPNANIGARPELRWLPLSRLVVDERYQRAIGRQGRPNVIRILENFEWNKFSPLIVTPIENDLFAIIDGQHHGTSALMHPEIDEVPCLIIRVTPEEAAACFAAINGQVTAISRGHIWRARVAAGDPDAGALSRVLAAADVTVVTQKSPTEGYRLGETLAVGTLESMFKQHGADVLTIALQAITQTGDGNKGCVVAPLIRALCAIVAGVVEFQRKPTLLYELMDEISLPTLLRESAAAASLKNGRHADVLRETLAGYLASAMEAAA